MYISRPVLLLLSFIFIVLSSSLIVSYVGRGWLNWETASHIASVIGTGAVFASLVFISRQLRHQTALSKANNSQSLLETASPFTLTLLQDDDLVKLYRDGYDKYDTFTRDEKSKYEHLLIWWLSFYENIHYQNTCGLLDKQVYDAWNNDLKYFIRRRKLHRHWGDLKDLYNIDFRWHVVNLMVEFQEELSGRRSNQRR